MALFGVSNGSLQFMTYELMKNWGFARKRRKMELEGEKWTPEKDKLVSDPLQEARPKSDDKQSNTFYTIASGVSKLVALTATYPYQVVRARIQV